jgi:phosphoglycerate dehydrogenase-like enzyme
MIIHTCQDQYVLPDPMGDRRQSVSSACLSGFVDVLGTHGPQRIAVCGAIGLQVARLGNAGCQVLGFERHVLRVNDVAIEQVELNELLSRSDIVSLHLPLTAETRGFVGREQLARMKPSAILINTARGPVVDQSALIEALGQNRLGGAGLDVFDLEPPLPANHPIFRAPNTVLVPHIGFETFEAMSAKADIALRHLEDFLNERGAAS